MLEGVAVIPVYSCQNLDMDICFGNVAENLSPTTDFGCCCCYCDLALETLPKSWVCDADDICSLDALSCAKPWKNINFEFYFFTTTTTMYNKYNQQKNHSKSVLTFTWKIPLFWFVRMSYQLFYCLLRLCICLDLKVRKHTKDPFAYTLVSL